MSTYQVRSLEEADLIIKQHERKTKTSYVLLRSTKNFGCIDVPSCSNDEYEVRFDTVGVPYCGVPFFVAGLKILQCQSFKEKGARGPAKKKEIKIELTGSGASVIGGVSTDGLATESTKTTTQRSTKKSAGGRSMRVSCTATIIMKEVIYYPEFQVFEHSRNGRLGVARQLKEVLRSKNSMQKDRIIYVTVPANSDHFGHPIGTVVNMKIPSKRIYVKNDYYGPVESSSSPGSPTRRLYFPVKEEKTDSVEKKRRIGSPDHIVGLTGYDSFSNSVMVPDPARSAVPAPTSLKKEPGVPNKAREVREVLQSIMAFTYKSGSPDAFETLHSDLVRARQRYIDNLGRKTPQQEQPQQPTQFQQPPQQIVLVKQPIKGHQHQSPAILAPRPSSAPQRTLQAKQPIMRLDQDPSSLSITINAVPTSLGSGTVTSLPTLQGPTLTALPSHSLSSLAALPSGSISSIPSFSTVVVPTGLQPSSVTLTIPAGSLNTLNAGSLTALNAGSLATLNAGSLATLNAGSLTTLNAGSLAALNPGSLATLNAGSLTALNAGSISSMQPVSISSLSSMHTNSLSSLQANPIAPFPATSIATFPARSIAPASMGSSNPIPVGSLASIHTGTLASLQTGVLPSIQAAPLPSIVAASISPLLSESIVSIPPLTSSESFNRDIMSTMTVTPIPSLTIGSMSSSMPQQLPLVAVSSSSASNTIISPYSVPSSMTNTVISPYTAASSIQNNTIIAPYTASSSIQNNTVIAPYTVSSSIQNNTVIPPFSASSTAPSSIISPYTVSSPVSSSVLSPYVSNQNLSSAITGVSSGAATALVPGTIISSNCLAATDTRLASSLTHQAPVVQSANGASSASCLSGPVSLAVSWPEASTPAPLSTVGSTAGTATTTTGGGSQRNVMVHLQHHNAMVSQQQQSDQEAAAKSSLQQQGSPAVTTDHRGAVKTNTSNEATTNQETSIIIEAMEAILNSHM